MVPDDVIEVAGRRIAAAARAPARIVLFGSHARGDAGPDSDLKNSIVHAALTEGRELAAA
jgi:predicted nucleotidyltransferase